MSRPCGLPAALCQHIAILRFMSFAYFDRILICIIRALFDVLGVSASGDGSCGTGAGCSVVDDGAASAGSGSVITGSPMIASAGSSGSLKSSCYALFASSCMIGSAAARYWLLSLLLVFSASLLI